MDKIYRRPTQSNGTVRKKKDEKNRHRNTFVNFRVTPTEKELIEARIAMTGMTRAEFFIQSCLYQTVLVKGNIRTFTAISEALDEIMDAVNADPDISALDPVQAEKLRMILEILISRFRHNK